jgi:glycosyltransferase involved in cell wall biosynthesis
MNEPRPAISAVIIARNEEANLASCLETLRWCDEIVLVDMESEDRTVAVARDFTDRIYSYPKVPAFDIAKKYAVEQAVGDWVLLIDADEMVPVALAEELRRQSLDPRVSIVEVPFRHYILGACAEYTGWGYTPLPRFFRKGAVYFTGVVHDYMHRAAGAATVRLASTPALCINHFNYRDATHFVEKLNRYTSIEAQGHLDRGGRFSYTRLVLGSLREFYRRYLPGQGYREGVRGFSLALMMAFYRALTMIKVWELQQYRDDPVTERYRRLREGILREWRK